MRFGEFSRSPLRLLRVELREDTAELRLDLAAARHLDDSLRRATRDHNESLQALADGSLCETCFFDALPSLESACCGRFAKPYVSRPRCSFSHKSRGKCLLFIG